MIYLIYLIDHDLLIRCVQFSRGTVHQVDSMHHALHVLEQERTSTCREVNTSVHQVRELVVTYS